MPLQRDRGDEAVAKQPDEFHPGEGFRHMASPENGKSAPGKETEHTSRPPSPVEFGSDSYARSRAGVAPHPPAVSS
jgi:hypothetical protein